MREDLCVENYGISRFRRNIRINLKSKATFLRCVGSFWQGNANVALLFSVHHRIDML